MAEGYKYEAAVTLISEETGRSVQNVKRLVAKKLPVRIEAGTEEEDAH
ncbi:MAG TPA: hypothetical protein VHP58_03350 [Alphaproteobacteria bacterium]|nr:hypothetical protein [Alphaproteobacteria bacterium]